MQDLKFYCKPAQGERIETVLTVPLDTSSAIHGVLTDPDGIPMSAVLVLLFQTTEDAPPSLIAQVTTDSDGHFAFGGLLGDTLYQIKIFQQNTRVRTLELSS